MNFRECAKFWERSESWLYRHWHELGGYKIGSKIQFDIDEQKELKKTFKKRFQKRLTTPFFFDNLSAKGVIMATLKKGRLIYGLGSVYKRKKRKKGKTWTSKKWTIDFYDENGDRIQKVIPHAQSREEAVHALMFEVQKAFDRKYKIERRRQEIGFKTFAQIYLEDYAMVAKKSWETDAYRLKVLNEFFKDIELRKINPLMIQKFRAWRLREGNSKTTCNRYLQLLKKMFNVAIEESYAEENPVLKVKLYSEKDTLTERVLTKEEEKRLLNTSTDHLRSILILALNTGMRRGEVLNLEWKQVDFENRRIRVEKTKSGKIRFIPINDILFHELISLKSKNGQRPFVLFNPETGKPYVDVMTSFRAACKRAEVEGLRFHDLRHTFASRLIKGGADIVTVQDLLGHSTVILTQRYTHSDEERKRAAVNLLCREDGDN